MILTHGSYDFVVVVVDDDDDVFDDVHDWNRC